MKNPIKKFKLSPSEVMQIRSREVDLDEINLESTISQKILNKYEEPEGFNKVGFARPLGGLFYQYFYAILGGIIIMLTFSKLLAILYPYPDSKAYANVGNVLFSFLFFVLNIPTSFSLERFVAEWRVKNPQKMLQYIRFYIWYQMFTGIILVLSTSIYTLYILNTGNLVYAKFLLLVYISREYPAMLDMFKSALKGLQKFHYESKINFISDTFIKPLCEYGCVLFGQHVIGSNPRFGPLMGIAIGYAIGTYIDDFISMAIAAHYLKKVMDPYGFTLKDAIIPHVEKDVWKSALLFGLKLSPPGLLSSLLGFFTFFWWYDMVPTYATLVVLNSTADQLGNLVRRAGGVYMKPVISESLNNDKEELTQYYIAMTLKFIFLMLIGMAVVLLSFLPIVVEVLLAEGGAENWVLAVGFIIPNIIASVLEPFMSTSKDVILGGNRPAFYSIMEVSATLLNFFVDYLLLFVLQWPQQMGIDGLVWLIPLKIVPINLLRLAIEWSYIHKKMVKVHFKNFAWQMVVAPIPGALVIIGVAQFWFNVVYQPLLSILGIYFAGGLTILFAFICLLWVYFPLYGFFGGWDDYNLGIFNEAVNIAGPSKFLFRPIEWANTLLLDYSKIHNSHTIPWRKADQEAKDLMKEAFVKEQINYIIQKA